jgi:hypothetical protein
LPHTKVSIAHLMAMDLEGIKTCIGEDSQHNSPLDFRVTLGLVLIHTWKDQLIDSTLTLAKGTKITNPNSRGSYNNNRLLTIKISN